MTPWVKLFAKNSPNRALIIQLESTKATILHVKKLHWLNNLYTPSMSLNKVVLDIDTVFKKTTLTTTFYYKMFIKNSQYILLLNYILRRIYLHHFHSFKLNPKEFIYSQS
jgi:hypothetical protein